MKFVRMLKWLWDGLRTACGDDAYERYCEHWEVHHAGQGEPLDRKAFAHAEIKRKWESGIRRCC